MLQVQGKVHDVLERKRKWVWHTIGDVTVLCLMWKTQTRVKLGYCWSGQWSHRAMNTLYPPNPDGDGRLKPSRKHPPRRSPGNQNHAMAILARTAGRKRRRLPRCSSAPTSGAIDPTLGRNALDLSISSNTSPARWGTQNRTNELVTAIFYLLTGNY